MDERFIATKICNGLVNSQIINEKDMEVYVYAYEIALSEVFNILGITLLAAITGNIWFSFVFLLSFVPQRVHMGGYHASSHLRCHCVSFGIFVACLTLSRFIADTAEFRATTVLAVFMVALFLAPVEADNKPLGEKGRRKNKKAAVILTVPDILIVIFRLFPHSRFMGFYFLTKWFLILLVLIPVLQKLVKGAVKIDKNCAKEVAK